MNTKGVFALEDTEVCMSCLKKKATHTYTISDRGYGSSFDSLNTKFQLCDDCVKDEYSAWVNEAATIEDEYIENYKYEDNIRELVKRFPIEAQELFYNRFATGVNADTMKPQDWIDYELDELPHDKCKEYYLYSPEERQAYKEKFPTCANVQIIEYFDGSRGSRCYYGAFGDETGNIGLQTQEKCYKCKYYKKRAANTPVKVIAFTEYDMNAEITRLENILEDTQKRLQELRAVRSDTV